MLRSSSKVDGAAKTDANVFIERISWTVQYRGYWLAYPHLAWL